MSYLSTDCGTCGHDENEHTDGLSRGCDQYVETWPRLRRCLCRAYLPTAPDGTRGEETT